MLRLTVIGCLCVTTLAFADGTKKAKPLATGGLPTKIDEIKWLKWKLLTTEISNLSSQHELALAAARDAEVALKKKKEEQAAMKESLMTEYKISPSDSTAEDGTINRASVKNNATAAPVTR